MGLRCGIIGLPNVGKSTLFKAITREQVDAENYPFCTISPNVSTVFVPDSRIKKLADIVNTTKLVPATLEISDIAGLVKGASKGEGLGNKFLSHIREMDALIHVVRCFDDSDIVHVEGTISPLNDIDIVETELMLSDLESLSKQIKKIEKESKTDRKTVKKLSFAKKVFDTISEGSPFRTLSNIDEEQQMLKSFFLLSSKPVMYVSNIGEGDIKTGNKYSKQVAEHAKSTNSACIQISANIEADISLLNEDERPEYLRSLNIHSSGLDQILKTCYDLLGLHTFFTAGKKEVRSWTIGKGFTAEQAAGVIHTDFQKGFICAEVIRYDDFIRLKSNQKIKEAGKLLLEGKNYVVKDGDIILFRFNV